MRSASRHGYDRASNRLWREDPVAASYGKDFDELYAYDGMYQLLSLDRGDLNGTKDAITAGSKTFAEDWSLDMTGNWKGYKKDDDGDGTWDLNQTRTHNAVNEITDIDASVGEIWISPTHDRNGNTLRIPQPGDPTQQFALAWDAWNRLVRVTGGGQSSSSSSSGSEVPVVAEYDYDALMRRIVKTVYDAGGSSSSSSSGADTEIRQYDGMYQLLSLDRGNLNGTKDAITAGSKTFAEDWSLDMTGNWKGYKKDDDGDGTWDLNQTRTHNAVNEITDIDASVGEIWISPTHDRNGNTLRIPQPGDPTQQFALAWDAWNRLVRVTGGGQSSSSSSSGSEVPVVAEYDYDALMRRIVKTIYNTGGSSSSSSSSGTDTEIRHFYYTDQWQCVEERLDAATVPDRQFVWGLRYVDDMLLRDRDVDAGGSLGKPNSGLDERLYGLQDPNWNVVALTDQAGAIQERYAHMAYGDLTILSPDFQTTRPTSLLGTQYTYTGRRLDNETGLYYYRARYCDGDLGRFIGRDPLETDLNLYRYCGNNPVLLVDPSGLWGRDVHYDLTQAIAQYVGISCPGEIAAGSEARRRYPQPDEHAGNPGQVARPHCQVARRGSCGGYP